jgi:hypothetical protein
MAGAVRLSCNTIWQEQVFLDWESQNNQKKESKEKDYETAFKNATTTAEKRAILSGMLRNFKNNTPGEGDELVDPAKYLTFIKRAITDGKMGQKDYFYYFIMGATITNGRGQTLISKEIFAHLDTQMKSIPELIFFSDFSSSKKNGRIVPVGTPGATGVNSSWTTDDFNAWRDMIYEPSSNFEPGDKTRLFLTQVVGESIEVKQRGPRVTAVATGDADHDQGPDRFAGLSYDMLISEMSLKADSGPKHSPDFYAGLLKGTNMYFTNKWKHLKDVEDEYQPGPIRDRLIARIKKEVAEKRRIALALVLIIKGNLKGEGKGYFSFSEAEYNKSSGGAYDLHPLRDGEELEGKIFSSLSEKAEGEGENFSSWINDAEKHGKSFTNKTFEIGKDFNAKTMEILIGKHSHLLTDTDDVDNFLEKYRDDSLLNVKLDFK